MESAIINGVENSPRVEPATDADRDRIAPRKRAKHKRPALTLSSLRSSVSNGTNFLLGVDHRTGWVRRFRDLLQAHEADLGSDGTLSGGQRSIIRRAAMLELQLELLESKFAENDGAATARELETYQRASNSLRRLLESLDLHRGRRSRDVTPTPLEYARQRTEAP